jgi:acetyl esterase/lipase
LHMNTFPMFRRALCAGVLSLALWMAACSSTPANTTAATTTTIPAPTVTHVPGGPYSVAMRHNVAYGPLAAESLDLCTPVGAPGQRPGVIMIHGGGWSQGDKTAYDSACTQLAANGVVAATLDYRLAPASVWSAQLVDVQLAVRWLRATAAQWSLDTGRLCAWGDSAGAHLAVFLGVDATIHPGDEAGVLANEAPNVTDCVVDDYGPVDLTMFGDSVQMAILRTLFGASQQADPAAYRDASPLFLVSSHSPPMLIVQGSQDTLVPPAQSLALQAALQHNNVPVQYISYPGGHSFIGLTRAQIDAVLGQIVMYLGAKLYP